MPIQGAGERIFAARHVLPGVEVGPIVLEEPNTGWAGARSDPCTATIWRISPLPGPSGMNSSRLARPSATAFCPRADG